MLWDVALVPRARYFTNVGIFREMKREKGRTYGISHRNSDLERTPRFNAGEIDQPFFRQVVFEPGGSPTLMASEEGSKAIDIILRGTPISCYHGPKGGHVVV